MSLSLEKSTFGTTPEGTEIECFTARNRQALAMEVMTYGAIVVALEAPDRSGKLANISLGFPTLEGYLARHPYFGATVGRYGNRIAHGKFELGQRTYSLATNDGPHHLHGGILGFDKVVWQAQPIRQADQVGVQFSYQSPNGEEGYPGQLQVTATYLLNDSNQLRIEFTATADQPTPINLTNHCYWNLHGAGVGNVLDHELVIEADHYLPVDSTLIPTGQLAAVQGSPLDFTQPMTLGSRLEDLATDPVGYDHCYVLRESSELLRPAATVYCVSSGRVMHVATNQPGMQLYSGNFLNGQAECGGFGQYEGLCLETQHFPDSPNQPAFPNTILAPGQTYRHVSVHTFDVR